MAVGDPGPPRLGLLADYAASASAVDEALDPASGAPRAHWQEVLAQLGALGPELAGRRQEARRLLRENGVSFSARSAETRRDDHGATSGFSQASERAWDLDPVPYLLAAEEWAQLEAGLAQRAQLLDAVLKDLYGPRHLLRSGLVPAELVYRHEGFLRCCDQVPLDGASAMLLYAADIARGADGVMRVVGDRTQAPAGAGYALEARIISSRILPRLIRECGVERLARFFQVLRGNLLGRAPNHKVDPRVVVLSPGPDDSSYFDHAYLASYLGYPLVQGQDLTVRQGLLSLKTIEGLQLVDIVVRRLYDLDADPLEVETGSGAGVPGMLEAVRQGHLVLANPLGAGVLENPALLPYLPRICERFLGEALRLNSAPTWWCGDPDGLTQVLDRLPALVVKGINRNDGVWFGPTLTTHELAELRTRIQAEPALFVGQEVLAHATTPAMARGEAGDPVRLEPRVAVTRCFASADDDGWAVMPGGFTRLLQDEQLPALSNTLEGECKDTWVLTPADQAEPVQWPARAPDANFIAKPESLPSRAAESLYWVGRYLERAEGLTRLARTLLQKNATARDYGDPSDHAAATVLRGALTKLTGYGGDIKDAEALLLGLASNDDAPGSLASVLHALERSANAVRDRWSTDTWRVIDDLREDLDFQQQVGRDSLRGLETTLDRLVSGLVAFTGLTLESTTHEDGWRFLQVGRRLERGLWLTRLLREALLQAREDAEEHVLLEALLVANESVMTHRRRYRSFMAPATVLSLLLLEPRNPRAVAAQVEDLQAHLPALPRARNSSGLSAEERAALQASTALRLADAGGLTTVLNGRRRALGELCEVVETQLLALDEALVHAYFAHVGPARQLVPLLGGH